MQYRVLAFTTATLLIILVFVGIPLQLAADRPGVVNVVGTLHGFLYLAYLFVAFLLTRKLKVPKWKMALICLAGTVPFAAFVAERKVTRYFNAATGALPEDGEGGSSKQRTRIHSFGSRWLTRRALLLHLEVAVVAPGCVIAGWWQATRALAGNGLSWVYSVEWPLFALLAIWGWWHLIHEDPEAYRLRKMQALYSEDAGAFATPVAEPSTTGTKAESEGAAARPARMLAMLICLDFVLGFVTLAFVPFNRPSGWLPHKGEVIYLAHAALGAVLVAGATALLVRSRDSPRTVRLSGRVGYAGLLLAAAGGLLADDQSLVRFVGMAMMLVGPSLSVFCYLIPTLSTSSRGLAASRAGSGGSSAAQLGVLDDS